MADKTSDAVRLLSSLDKFRVSPSSGGFLDVLTEIADGKLVVKDDLRIDLESITAQAFVFTHEDLFTFDKALWSVLPRLSIPIDWERLTDRRNSSSSVSTAPATNTESSTGLGPSIAPRIKDLVVDVLREQDEADQARSAALEKSGNDLEFFAEVNALIGDIPEFEPYRRKSVELESLLIPLCVEAGDYKAQYPTVTAVTADLTQDHWRWIGRSIIAIYAAGLEQGSNAEDESDAMTILAQKLMCRGHLSLLHATVARCGIYLDSTLLQRLLRETPTVGDAESGEPALFLSKTISDSESTDGIADCLSPYFAAICAPAYTRSYAWRFFINAWFRERNRDEPAFEDDYFALPAAVNCAGFLERLFFNQVIDKHVNSTDDLRRLLRRYGLGGIDTVELSAWLISEVRDFDSSRLYNDGRELAVGLVEKANTNLESRGFPQALNIARSIYDLCDRQGNAAFLLRRSVFYQSISTLALNLSQSEWDTEHFDEETPTRCYLNGARSIMRAGYPEHAVIFLAYGLLRAFLVIPNTFGEVSVRDLSDSLTKDFDTHYVAKHLPFAMQVILDVAPRMTAATRLWLQTFVERYPQRKGAVLSLVKTPPAPASEPPVLPPWFHDGTEALTDAVSRANSALLEPTTHHDEWRQTHRRLKVDDALSEMLRQLEAQIKFVFRDVHRNFLSSEDFQKDYAAVAPRTRFDNYFTWAWVESFLGGIATARSPSPRDLVALVNTAESLLPGLGDLIRFLPGKIGLVRDFAKAREYRRDLHHTDAILPPPRAPSGGRGVVPKQVVGRNNAQWIYHYVMTDYGQLYEHCAKLVAVDPPEQR